MRLWIALALVACGSNKSTTDDLTAATATATALIDAVRARDYPAMCATHTTADRARLAKLRGTCEKGMEASLEGASPELFERVIATNPRRRGDGIEVDVSQPKATKPATTLFLVREDNRWLISVPPPAAPAPPPDAAPKPQPAEPLPITDPDVIAAQATIDAYFGAMAKQDYAGMCATRTAEARQEAANSGGTCEKLMEVFTRRQAVEKFATATYINPRRRDGVIAFDMKLAGDGPLFGPLYLRLEGGRWLLFERAAADKF